MNSGVVDGSTTVVSICANVRRAAAGPRLPGRTFPEASGSFRKFPEVFRVRRNRVAAMRLPRRTRPQCGMALVRRCTDLELAARVRHGVGTQGYSGYSGCLELAARVRHGEPGVASRRRDQHLVAT